MDEMPLRAVFERLGATPQPPSAVNLDLARARGRRRMRRNFLAASTPVLAVGLIAGLVVAGAVSWPGSHGRESAPSHAPKIRGILSGVSCPASQRCVAVGGYYEPGPRYGLIEQWDGVRWSIMKGSSPPPHVRADLYGISCAGVSDCTAVGASTAVVRQPTTTPRRSDVLIEHWNGAVWTAVPSLPASGQLESVSCTGASDCMAVGMDSASGGPDTRPLSARWNGSRWAGVPTPSPAGAGYSILSAVSCTSPVNCVAVGEYFTRRGAGDRNHILIERWDGSAWSIEGGVPRPAGSISSYLFGVSCTAARNCMAVGSARYPHRKGSSWGGTRDLTLIEHWNGSAWSVISSPNRPGPPSDQLSGVACAGAADCTAVGVAARRSPAGGADRSATLIEHWNGVTWSIVESPSPSTSAGLNQVACSAASDCAAVGGYGNLDNRRTPHTLIESWNGVTWSAD